MRGLPAAIAAVLLTLVVTVTGCSTVPGTPRPADVVTRAVDPSFVHGTDGGEADALAATVVTDVQAYWRTAFPRHFGAPWRDLDGGFFSVDTTNTAGKPPPCTAEVSDVEGNAFYCATVDTIAWDRAALLPVLREHYGDAAVVVVLAHEIGHAVQQRSGDRPGSAALSEAVADCYAGSYVRWVVDGHSDHLRLEEGRLDSALRALINFRDPVGTNRSDGDVHGTAFDRVSAFQDGYRSGPQRCTGMTTDDQGPAAGKPATERANHPVREVLESRGTALRAYFADLASRRGARWTAPEIRRSDRVSRCADSRSPVAYCAPSESVVIDHDELAELNYTLGDQASATLLASRYALSALPELGLPTTGAAAGRSAACLTGAYTGSLVGSGPEGAPRPTGPPLSANDLDEAVTAVLTIGPSQDSEGLTGFDRIAAFRAGVRGGPGACGT